MDFSIVDYLSQEEKEDWGKLKSPEAKRIFIREFFKRDFRAFVYLLGYKDLGEFHKKEIESIAKVCYLESPSRRLWLWARGHFKTSLITVAHSIWLMVNNPSIRLLEVSNTLEVAKKILGEIKNHFTNNADFRYFFREFCPIANKEGKIEFGTTEQFTLPNRVRILKEPTLMIAGIGTNLTGLHFDYMKIDDLVTRDSVTNDTQIQASKDYYASLRQLFDNPTEPKEDIVGTTYHYNDLYAGILKNPDFIKSIVPAKVGDKVTFIERFSDEGLQAILNDPSVGPYEFNSQYLLNPVNPADAKFKIDWWKEYESLPEGLVEYICVDPASTQKKKSDFTVIEKWGVDWEGKHYFIEGIRDKLEVFNRIEKVVQMAKSSKKLAFVKYEVLGGRHGDLESLKKRFLEEKLYIEPTETKNTTSSKVDRIEQRLVGQFHSGMILFPKISVFKSDYDGRVYDFVQLYKTEYLQFPYNEHDDILDCHSQMFEEPSLIQKGKKSVSEVKKAWGTADDWDRYYAMLDREQRNNPYLTREQALIKLKSKQWQRLLGAR